MPIESRVTRLRSKMKDAGIDAIYVTSAENHRYLCGFGNPDGQLIITDNYAAALEDFRYTEAARREVSPDFEVIMPEGSFTSAVADIAEKYGVSVIGFEDAALTCRQYDQIRSAMPDTDVRGISDMLMKMREFKDESEVEKVIAAQRIAEKSFTELLTELNRGMTETEAAARLEYLMKKNGADGISFDTIAISGSATSSPHGVPRNVKLSDGFVTFDFGATVGGYHSDMTRTVVLGHADDEMKRLYDTVLTAQCAVLGVIKCGMELREADGIARGIINDAGYSGCFGHSLGHGVGLEIHECPNLSPNSKADAVLAPGHVVTVEPGIYVAGKYGCRIEDMVYITPDGAVNLTKMSKELTEIF